MRWSTLFVAAGLGVGVLAGVPSGARADDPESLEETTEESSEASSSTVRSLTDEEARDLARALDRAARRRDASDVLPALEAIAGCSHEDFHKPLLKLVGHESTEVALAAADRLLEQRVEDERDAGKLADQIWKKGWNHRENDRRWVVKGRLLRAIARLRVNAPLEPREYRDLEGLWRQVHGSPDRAFAPAVVDVCRYVEATEDTRLFRMLAEALDEPVAAAVNAPTNPPATWWEERWHLWNDSKAAIAAALTALTGELFKSTEAARTWAEEHGREHEIEW